MAAGFQFWQEEHAKYLEHINPDIIRLLIAGAESGASMLPEGFDLLLNWDYFNQEAISFLNEYGLSIARDISETTERQAINVIENWIRSGEKFDNLSKALEPIFLSKNRAEMIGTTEVTRIFAEGNIISWKATGLVSGKRWMTAFDELVCPICEPLHMQIAELDVEGFTTDISVSGELQSIGLYAPPAHVRCILPGNKVMAPILPSAATQSFYVGRAIEFRLDSGRVFSVTENHPIFSRDKWQLAKELREGDYLVACANPERIAASIMPNNNHMPTPIEDIFSAFVKSSEMRTMSMPASPEQFHGDGRRIDGNINIVFPERFLLRNYKTRLLELARQSIFNLCDMHKRALSTERLIMQNFFAPMLAPHRFMSSSNLSGALLGRHLRPFELFSSRAPAGFDPRTQEPTPKRPTIDSRLAREFILRFASDITLDKIIEIRNFDYSGHVYDLQVDDYELYFCNDIITHNCRCWLQPIVSEALLERRIEEALLTGIDVTDLWNTYIESEIEYV